jgi:mono/diheme cytochrome c family protein
MSGSVAMIGIRSIAGFVLLVIAGSTVLAQSSSSREADGLQQSLASQFSALWETMSPSAQRGYRHLVSNVYLPYDFDEDVLRSIDQEKYPAPFVDSDPSAEERSRTLERFGLARRPDDPSKPLQYVVTPRGEYVMNCFACHGGNLYGATYPGAPNTLYGLESLTDAVRRTKLKLGKPLAHMDMGSIVMPLGTTTGTSNAVMFGVALMNYRDVDLKVHMDRQPALMTHHDMDAPPWWHFHKKQHIYIDGFAEKGHRGLMQFMLVRQNGPDKFRAWEEEFRDVYNFLSELRPPKYPLPIDGALADRGKIVFENNCADCHGTYGQKATYPELLVSLDEVGTDPVRLQSLTPAHRAHYGESWFADYGAQDTRPNVDGYIAPPLDGVWASAPYLHNGSVPTLWHLLNPDKRPTVWKRTHLALDTQNMGLHVETFDDAPSKLKKEEKRRYFDTRVEGKSASGHDFPASLTDDERRQLLEYLKTL